MRIICVGEILWDVIGAREHIGGAPLNFAAHARQLGHELFPVSAVGHDERGQLTLQELQRRGISTEFVQVLPGQHTGTAEVELDGEGKPAFHIRRPAAYDFVDLDESRLKRLSALEPSWIYFGTLYNTSKRALNSTLKLLSNTPSARRFYDVNLREGNWNLALIEQLSSQATVIKLNDSEAEFLDGSLNAGEQNDSVEHFCRRWSDQYHCATVCVTLGERGCGVFHRARYWEVGGYRVQVTDTVGAGDAFSAAFLHGLDRGWATEDAGAFANAVGALVASRPGAVPEWHIEECWRILGRKLP